LAPSIDVAANGPEANDAIESKGEIMERKDDGQDDVLAMPFQTMSTVRVETKISLRNRYRNIEFAYCTTTHHFPER
jgi:hypothetical protein